jgi:guanylate kinase
MNRWRGKQRRWRKSSSMTTRRKRKSSVDCKNRYVLTSAHFTRFAHHEVVDCCPERI